MKYDVAENTIIFVYFWFRISVCFFSRNYTKSKGFWILFICLQPKRRTDTFSKHTGSCNHQETSIYLPMLLLLEVRSLRAVLVRKNPWRQVGCGKNNTRISGFMLFWRLSQHNSCSFVRQIYPDNRLPFFMYWNNKGNFEGGI